MKTPALDVRQPMKNKKDASLMISAGVFASLGGAAAFIKPPIFSFGG